MSSQVIVDDGFSFSSSLEQAKKQAAYYEEDLLVTVAGRVVAAMNKHGVSRSDLARKMGVSPAYITKILRGHANLSLESLAKLAFALGLKWECLLIQQDCNIDLIAGCDAPGGFCIKTTQTISQKKSAWGMLLPSDEQVIGDYSFQVKRQNMEYKEVGSGLSVSA